MKKIFILFTLFLLFSSGLEAQRRSGLFGHRRGSNGSTYLFTALSPYSAFCLGDMDGWYNGSNFMGSLGMRHIYSNNFGYRATFSYGSFQGKDTDPLGYRNASSAAKVLELAAQAEYVIWGGPYSQNSNPNSVFIFGGIGVLNSSANAISRGVQLPSSNIITPFIPIGVGYQYDINDTYSVGAEVGGHLAFSDMVEGYNPHVSGNKFNDVVAYFAFTFTWKISDGN